MSYTRDMRKGGQYPEKVLVAVKTTVRQTASPMLSESALSSLVQDSAQWVIHAYFDEP